MKNKRYIKLFVVALFTISVQLVLTYVKPSISNNEEIVCDMTDKEDNKSLIVFFD